MARLIGKELIDQLEVIWSCFNFFQELRSELTNLIEISKDIDEAANKDTSAQSMNTASSILSQSKNANFLNQELQFFINDLQEKATHIGLDEDALLPSKTPKDRKILKYLKRQGESSTRPQSATNSESMRSSFYSMNTTNFQEFGQEETLVKQLKIQNILELSSQDMKIVKEFKQFMEQ